MISVVIPLFNKQASIGKVLTRVLEQSYDDFELIIVNDGSTDGSLDLVAQFNDARIKVISQSNSGVSVARNVGIQAAKNDWIALLDADDEWESNHLFNIVSAIEKFPFSKVIATAYDMKLPDGSIIKTRKVAAKTPEYIEEYFSCALNIDPPISSSCVAFKRENILSIGGFPVGIKSGEDLLTWARLCVNNGFVYIPEISAYYNVPARTIEASVNAIRVPPIIDEVGNKLLLLKEISKIKSNSIDKYYSNWKRIRAVTFLELGMRKAFLFELRQAVFYGGLTKKDIAMILLALLPNFLMRKTLCFIRKLRVNT